MCVWIFIYVSEFFYFSDRYSHMFCPNYVDTDGFTQAREH